MMFNLLQVTIEDIIKNPEHYDKNCTTTIDKFGKDIISNLPETHHERSTRVEGLIFIVIHRMLCEIDFSLRFNSTPKVDSSFNIVNENIDSFPQDLKSRLIYNRYSFPYDIIKRILNSEEGKNILEFKRNTEKFEEISKRSNQEIEEHLEKIEQQKLTLEKYEQAFNFVGLHEGFNNLHKTKSKEKNYSLTGMFILCIIMFSILACELWYGQTRSEADTANITNLILIVMPLVAIEILLIYLFRVVLANYQSIKKQLLQIELRMTLCQFIQSYTEYANEMKAADKASLEKFENLIFSGIVMDDQQLPSTFDGIEQISKMMSALKSGPK